jgi:uncharacterized protein (DUF736 family)
MIQIGTCTCRVDGFQGQLKTLSLDVDLCLVPAGAGDAENAPDYRIHIGTDDQGLEVGAGWKRTAKRAGTYVLVDIDDPALAQSISANLVRSGGDGPEHHLRWNNAPRCEPRR